MYDGANHIVDADFVFNQEQSMGTSDFFCFFSLGVDVHTVALHEFGHWGVLRHTSDSNAVMSPFYEGCRRTPTQHDVDSMNANYAGHTF